MTLYVTITESGGRSSVLYVDGYVGSAFSFDGIDDDARVVILEGENLDFGGKSQLSVEAWIKTTDNQGSFVEQWKGVSTFGLRVRDGKVRFFYLKDQNAPEGGEKWQFLLGATIINDDQWHHVAGVLTGTQMRIYVDGVLDAVVDQVGSIPDPGPPHIFGHVLLGFSPDLVGTTPYEGLVDEVAVYDRPLSGLEIQRLFAAGTSGKCVQ